MPIKMSTARALCTKQELAIVLDSTPARLSKLSAADLRRDIGRARKLRDKYKDLAARQRREARGKDAPRGKRPSLSNENTVRKQELFDEVLQKFEAKLAKLEGREGPRATRQLPRTKTKTKKGKAAKAAASAAGAERNGAAAAPKSSKKSSKKAAAAKPARKPAGLVSSNGSAKSLLTAAAAGGKRSNLSLLSRSEATRGVRVKKTNERRNVKAILGHVSARGRRSQARRDSRAR